MARYTYNSTDLDLVQNITAVTSSTVTLTTTDITSATFTAPNTSNKVTGIWVFFDTLPTSGDIVFTLVESGVNKTTVTMNNADITYGWNYARFSTPYQFTTTSANAYAWKAKNSSTTNQGRLRHDGSKFTYAATIDNTIAVSSLVVGDDLWVGGFHDSGLTPQTLTLTGTALSFGSGTDKAFNITATSSVGAAITVGNGGTCKFDTTASTTVQVRGAVYVTQGGLFDMSANSSDVTKVNKLIFDCETANGNYGIISAAGNYGGQIKTNGKVVDYRVKRGTGTGTTADPWITPTAIDAQVGDEVIFGGATDYAKNELKYIKVRNSSTSFTLSDTSGGAESGLAQTHDTNSYVGLMTRNSIVTSLTTTRGYWVFNLTSNTTPVSAFDYTRFEYNNIDSGGSFQAHSQGNPATLDGVVMYNSAASGRETIRTNYPATYTGIILYNQQGQNYSGQSGLMIYTSNVTLNNCLSFNAPSSTNNAGFISVYNSTNLIANDCHGYGNNANNSSLGYAFYIGSGSGSFYNCTVNSTRKNAVLFQSGDALFENCSFGTIGNNTTDIYPYTSTLDTALFRGCSFGSTNLITNYLNMLNGSSINFQDMDSNTSKHRWYTNYGSGWSSGSGLTDTTVRTAGSLALAIKPEDNSTGFTWETLIPAVPDSNCGIFGYAYRNATFSSGTFKVDLYLPNSLTPDVTYTFPTTTGSWLPFNIATLYSGDDPRYARVVFTAVTATAGAYAFIDDLYDAGTNNKVAGLDLWYRGKPSPVMIITDFTSAIPQIASAVWDEPLSAHTTAGTMGKIQGRTSLTNDVVIDVLG